MSDLRPRTPPRYGWLRCEEIALRTIRWPFTFWPRWTRVELWAARRLAVNTRRWFGWDDD